MSSRKAQLATAAARFEELPVIELEDGLKVHEARTWASRRDGLSGLPDLPADWGLLIAPCRSIHMVGMQFPLDLVWVGKDGDVVRVDAEVAPRKMRTCLRARSVIEVAAGQGERFAAAWARRAPHPLPGSKPSDSELMQ
jgi:uncharacterized membrane protein (UPF0127 family)